MTRFIFDIVNHGIIKREKFNFIKNFYLLSFSQIPQTVENADDFKKVEAILLKEFPGGMYK